MKMKKIICNFFEKIINIYYHDCNVFNILKDNIEIYQTSINDIISLLLI